MDIEYLKVYNLAMDLIVKICTIVDRCSYFAKDTVGKQLVKASDSIAANLSEGLGRYHYKEAKNFGYYSRGSLFETKTWLTKAHNRKLITHDQFKKLIENIEGIGRMLNGYINSIGEVKEPAVEYGDSAFPMPDALTNA